MRNICAFVGIAFAAAALGAPLHETSARQAPEWMRQGVMYQILMRSFTPEGTLKAAQGRLANVAELGATIAYLCPVTAEDDDMDKSHWSDRQVKSGFNNPKNPYRIKDYYHVDPEYGTDQDLKDFVQAAHKLGLRVMLDMVYFHCGPTSALLKEHPDFFRYDASGKLIYAQWHFPALNFKSAALREYLAANMEYWVKEFDVDGFRCDVADAIPLDFWEKARARLEAIRPDIGILAEGDKPQNLMKAFDCNYGFGFSQGALLPVLDGKKPVSALRQTWMEMDMAYPRGGRMIRYTLTHDVANDELSNRREKTLGKDANAAGLAVCFTLDGIPFLFNGQEVCNDARCSFVGRTPIPWEKGETAEGKVRFALLKKLCGVRRAEYALTDGTVTWLDNDKTNAVVSFLRNDGKGRDIVSVVNLSRETLRVRVKDAEPETFAGLVTELARQENGEFLLGGYGFFIGARKAADPMSEAFWKLWNPEEQAKIDADIERNRKADTVVEGLPANADVRVEQLSHDFLFGAHIFNFNQLGTPERNRAYRDLYGSLFNEATIAFYWKKFEPVPGKPRFAETATDTEAWWNACRDPKRQEMWRRPPSDPVVAFCRSKNIWLHGHPLTWENITWQYPKWVYEQFCPAEEKAALEKIPAGQWKTMTPEQIGTICPKFLAEINRLIQKRIFEIAKHYQGKLNSYDVVNESASLMPGSIDESAPAVKNHSFKTLLPGGYTSKSFRWADEAFPKTVSLNINDYNNGEIYVRQVKEMLARGIRITRMGSQMHLFNPKDTLAIAEGKILQPFPGISLTPQGMRKQFQILGQAGLPIILSEITITAPTDDARGRAIQAVITRQFYRLWFSVKPMVGIVWWNVVDDCGALGEPCTSGLFTRAMQPKPSFYALDQLINHEWKTTLTVRSDAQGVLRFRGFRGNYRVSWLENAKIQYREISVK